MSGSRFEWDPAKASANRRKHGVAFDEAMTVWDDPNVFFEYDAKHSDAENRLKAIGFSERNRLLSVIFTDRDDAIRIISARKASATDRSAYAEALG
jgi:uncharacterized DUF497 family protein